MTMVCGFSSSGDEERMREGRGITTSTGRIDWVGDGGSASSSWPPGWGPGLMSCKASGESLLGSVPSLSAATDIVQLAHSQERNPARDYIGPPLPDSQVIERSTLKRMVLSTGSCANSIPSSPYDSYIYKHKSLSSKLRLVLFDP